MASGFSILNATLDKSHWVLQINDLIDQDALLPATQTLISIFRLPDSAYDSDPAAYLPCRVAFGPYHHFHPELYKMELFKLGKAKNLKWSPQLHQLADQLKALDLKIRACYDQPLEINGDTLSWLLLVDGLFLIHLLLENKFNYRPFKFPSNIFYRQLWSEVQIVNDMVKLENQIPLFVLNEICPEEPIKFLAPLLYNFFPSVSPFQLPFFNSKLEIFGSSSSFPEIFHLSHHLLHFLYSLILLIPSEIPASSRIGMSRESSRCSSSSSSSSSSSVEFLSESLEILGSVINIAFIQQIKDTLGLIQRVFKLLGFINKSNLSEKNPPLVIPSASDLKSAGITLESTRAGVLKSRFDKGTRTLTLPCINLDGFTQVLLKNLVAFEAMAELNPPCLVSYVSLMNGLLRNSKDLKILEKADIVRNHLNSKEAVELFNRVENSTSSLRKESVLSYHLKGGFIFDSGAGKFIQDCKRNYELGLGRMAEEINKFYSNCWRMKMKKFMSFVFKCFAILVLIFLLLFVIARFVCKFLTCPAGIFKTTIALHQMY